MCRNEKTPSVCWCHICTNQIAQVRSRSLHAALPPRPVLGRARIFTAWGIRNRAPIPPSIRPGTVPFINTAACPFPASLRPSAIGPPRLHPRLSPHRSPAPRSCAHRSRAPPAPSQPRGAAAAGPGPRAPPSLSASLPPCVPRDALPGGRAHTAGARAMSPVSGTGRAVGLRGSRSPVPGAGRSPHGRPRQSGARGDGRGAGAAPPHRVPQRLRQRGAPAGRCGAEPRRAGGAAAAAAAAAAPAI